MSEAVTALAGARYEGAVVVEDAGLTGMLTVRADLSDAAIKGALTGAGIDLPTKLGATGELGNGVIWMSPDELMVLTSYDDAEAKAASLLAALDGLHALVVNVSDARTVLRVSGSDAGVRETLAKLTPADLRPGALAPMVVRRTRMAQVPAAFWLTGEGEAVVIAFRSVADYVFGILSRSAMAGGEVGHF